MQTFTRKFLSNFVWWGCIIFVWLLFVDTEYEHSHFEETHRHSFHISFTFLLTLLFAFLNTLSDWRMDRNMHKFKISFRKKLLILFVRQFVFIIIASFILYEMIERVLISPATHDFQTFADRVNMLGFWFYAGVAAYALEVVKAIDRKLGPGNLWKIIIGAFSQPKELSRIFMFMDLQGATNLAERLGYLKYSELLQECFHDISVVQQYGAHVFQYVGDEVVLVWEPRHGLNRWNCVRAYFAFIKRIEDKKEFYQANFDAIPFFKAGVHIGNVVLAEVGEIKREIAYHGDTINTASRIQDKCNELNAALLASKALMIQLEGQDTEDTYEYIEMGAIPLKGKKEPVELVSIIEKSTEGEASSLDRINTGHSTTL